MTRSSNVHDSDSSISNDQLHKDFDELIDVFEIFSTKIKSYTKGKSDKTRVE